MENPLWVSSCLLLAGPALWPRHRMLLCPILGCREERRGLLLTLGQMFSIYIHDTDIGWSEKNFFIFLGTGSVCFSTYLGSPDSSHCLPPLSRLWAWYWLRHALSGSRRPDTGTDVFSDNTTTQREQQKWGNLREDNRTSTPCIFSPLLYWSFPEWPAVSDMDWI